MHCPRHDNLLIDQKPRHTDGLSVHFLVCPTCYGKWLSSFDANYIQSIDLADDDWPIQLNTENQASHDYACPLCRKTLERSTGENIPPDVLVYHCPDHHGYFFPAGELKKFKIAQEVKIAYHQRWNVPLASVGNALLMTFVGLIVSVGLIVGVIESQRQQTIATQAEEIIISQKTYTDPEKHAVTIIARTTEKVTLTVTVDNKEYSMLAPDRQSHVVRIEKITPGKHTYYFHFESGNHILRTQEYSFGV